MLAVVKKPRTKRALFEVKGEIPPWLVSKLKIKYGNNLELKSDDEAYVNIIDTDWYKEVNRKMKPGDYVRIYRENFGWTQEALGKRLGHFSRQNVSAIENGRRGISKEVAKKLSTIFQISINRFV